MLWFNSHRRFRAQLSAYIDAELSAKDALALDAHVRSCETCSSEIEELRMASAALQELPDVDVPRSFALSPADLARPAPPAPVRSLNSGLRVTGAGLAAVLAVLLVLDSGGVIGGGDRDTGDRDAESLSAAIQAAPGDEAMERDGVPSEAPAARSGSADAYFATDSPAPVPNPLQDLESGAGAGTDGAGVGGAGVASGPPGTPSSAGIGGAPVDSGSPAAPTETIAAGAAESGAAGRSPEPERVIGLVTPTPTEAAEKVAGDIGLNDFQEQDDGTLTTVEANADSDDGPSALLVTEIVLAALLGVSIVGVAAATYAERRRR